ncbi:DUF4157 domain-containing protein [Chitinophaga filiformis]|uniref:DUF4157 domain-containing protein n=1 Tax=Chitinophaga filiformis TaxID=104663 RepID=A0ABY4HVE3_CHIFI|nr:DUF4157 domain-containing protein [Chitinophaga filiformis]UPK67365.1 DUF4157 domain-containing protein [Chitinophaga filiformis]
MKHEHNPGQANQAVSQAIANSHGLSGVSQPAVMSIQKATADKQTEQEALSELSDEHLTPASKSFIDPYVNKNAVPASPDIQPFQLKNNNTGMPDHLKSGLENLSGYDLSHVNVHFNSSRPAQLNALAYAQGSDIHLGPGQEKHLPHEGWHVVQQMQGRVAATKQLKTGVPVNDNEGLEREADRMGDIANAKNTTTAPKMLKSASAGQVVQRLVGFEIETHIRLTPGERERALQKDKVLLTGMGWTLTVEKQKGGEAVEFKIRAVGDQSDPSLLEDTMTSLEIFATRLEGLKEPITLGELGKRTGFAYDETFSETRLIPSEDMTGMPQMTAGISLERITNLLQDMTKEGTQLFGGPGGGEVAENVRAGISSSLVGILEGLTGFPKSYQGFISLLVSYLHGTRNMVPSYFKAAVAALSRADLGKFMEVPEIRERRDLILKDVLLYAKAKGSDKVFPHGIKEKEEVVDAPITIEFWVNSIISGNDALAWSPQMNQENREFEMEPVGPRNVTGVPLEIRSLQKGIPVAGWKPYILHLFSYVSKLNTSSPQAYEELETETLLPPPKLPVVHVQPIDHLSNIAKMEKALAIATEKRDIHKRSWTTNKLVEFIKKTIFDYKVDMKGNDFKESSARWSVYACNKFVEDMDTAIAEEELQKI